MRVVLDTNVVISALLWYGPPHDILKLIEKKMLTLCMTPALIEELRDVLRRPSFSFRIEERRTSSEELIAGVIDLATLHPNKKIPPVVKEDPDDDQVLACALASGAEHIITGDSHLLKLERWFHILILSPRQFLNHFPTIH